MGCESDCLLPPTTCGDVAESKSERVTRIDTHTSHTSNPSNNSSQKRGYLNTLCRTPSRDYERKRFCPVVFARCFVKQGPGSKAHVEEQGAGQGQPRGVSVENKVVTCWFSLHPGKFFCNVRWSYLDQWIGVWRSNPPDSRCEHF